MPDTPTQDTGCQKVDFLFVIDNSVSMHDYQTNLVANFPDFIAGIQATLAEVEEYQVGIISTDKSTFNDPNCQELGSLIVETGGWQSSKATCGPYANGKNFMTEADDLAATFSCAATLGIDGSAFELPMMALQETLSKQSNDPGECNEGFLRDDALLVVIIIITDEPDGPGDPERQAPDPLGGPFFSPGTPQDWYDAVVAYKGNIEKNVVVVSFLNWLGGPCEKEVSNLNGENIKAFTEMFTYGFVGGICQPYGPIFTEATSVIDGACDTFTPPG